MLLTVSKLQGNGKESEDLSAMEWRTFSSDDELRGRGSSGRSLVRVGDRLAFSSSVLLYTTADGVLGQYTQRPIASQISLYFWRRERICHHFRLPERML